MLLEEGPALCEAMTYKVRRGKKKRGGDLNTKETLSIVKLCWLMMSS